MSRERELLERVLFQFGKWHMQAEYDWDSENDLKEEIRAYLAEQKQYDALADRYVEGVTGGLEKCREYMETQVLVAKELLSAPRPEFVRLSEEEVTEILTSAYDMYAAICAVENRLVEKNRG